VGAINVDRFLFGVLFGSSNSPSRVRITSKLNFNFSRDVRLDPESDFGDPSEVEESIVVAVIVITSAAIPVSGCLGLRLDSVTIQKVKLVQSQGLLSGIIM